MTAEPLPITTPAEPPSWTCIEASAAAVEGYAVLHCFACGAEMYDGYAQMVRIGPELEEIRLALCEECAYSIMACTLPSTLHARPASAVMVQVIFAPGDSPQEAEVLIFPEPANAQTEVDILELAASRLSAYAEAYAGAARAEDDEEPEQ